MIRFRHALLTGASFAAFIPTLALAAPVPATPTIVVSATRSPMLLTQIASSMTVIDEEEIARKNKPAVIDLLRDTPGVTVAQNGGPGQTARVFLRGANSNHVLVLIDGVRANDPSDPNNAYDFSNLSTDNIERIEILRGPQSTLYGSDAIGGVIQVITKTGKGAPSYSGFAEYGRYNSSRAGVGAQGAIAGTSYSLEASHNQTDGFSAFNRRLGGREKDGSDGYTFSGNIAQRITDHFTAHLTTRYSRVNSEFDMLGSFTPDSTLPENDTRQMTTRLAGEHVMHGGQWIQEFAFGVLDVSRYVASGFDYDHHMGQRHSFEWLHRLKFIPQHELNIGIEAWKEYYTSWLNLQRSVVNKAIFIDDQFTINDHFFVNTGVRLDEHQIFGNEMTWKIAPGYRIDSTGTTLKASYGTGFKAPSLYNLYSEFFGTPTLQPERSKGIDAGFEQELLDGKVMFGSSVFHNDISQLLDVVQLVPFDPFSFRYVNIGRARTYGTENFFTWQPNEHWTLNTNYTYTRATDVDAKQSLVRRPKHQANASVVYRRDEQWDFGVNMRFVGARSDFNQAFARTRLPSHILFGVTANYALTPNVTLYSRVDNLLDKRYEELSGFGTSGLAVYGGVKTTF